jgi:hypothetical protein
MDIVEEYGGSVKRGQVDADVKLPDERTRN